MHTLPVIMQKQTGQTHIAATPDRFALCSAATGLENFPSVLIFWFMPCLMCHIVLKKIINKFVYLCIIIYNNQKAEKASANEMPGLAAYQP